jgi:hypothetical protein
MLRAIGVIIALISVLVTFVVLVSAHNITTDIFSGWNMIDSQAVTDSQNSTYAIETEPSESITLEGLSPQDESDLAVACSSFLEHC